MVERRARQAGYDGVGPKSSVAASGLTPASGRGYVLTWKSLSDGQKWVHAFSQEIKRPAIILLSGKMGAGKTQFVRWLFESINGTAATPVSSPTFSIHNRYTMKNGFMDHVDLYRLTSDQDLESSGFWDLLNQKDGLLVIEWADRLPDQVWPKDWNRHYIQIQKLEGESREVTRRDVRD